MAFTYGFYNSVNHDRKYDAVQMGMIFDGIITDGIYATYLKAMVVKASENASEVIVQPGRAWFNHTWSYNDSDYPIATPDPEVVLDRIDTLVLDINAEDASRSNSFLWVQGTPTSQIPEPPELIHTATHNQYPLCNVYRKAGTTQIYAADITNRVGTSDCPFVTGVLEGINIDDLLAQWDDEFHTWERATKSAFEGWMVKQQSVYTAWWDALKLQMAGDVADVEAWVASLHDILDSETASHLQLEIDKIKTLLPTGSYIKVTTPDPELRNKTVTITDEYNESVTSTFNAQGVAEFKTVPLIGNLTITSTDGIRTATTVENIEYFSKYSYVLAFWNATVNIQGDEQLGGSTVSIYDSSSLIGTVVLNAEGEGSFSATYPDTYTFSVTFQGETYSQELEVSQETTYTVSLSIGFNYSKWLEYGEVTGTYASLDEVLEDKRAVRKLMTKHASVDYLASAVEVSNDISKILNNDICAKWINLRDYALDTLHANQTLAAVMDEADKYGYGEWALLPQVPKMTGNTAPYGQCLTYGNVAVIVNSVYKAFDGDDTTYINVSDWNHPNNPGGIGYKFTRPIKAKKAEVYLRENGTITPDSHFKIQASNEGTDDSWVDVSQSMQSILFYESERATHFVELNSDEEYLYYRLYFYDYLPSVNNGAYAMDAYTLQFYAWGPKGVVPEMTSNTAPYGTLTGDGGTSGHDIFNAFDGNDSTYYQTSATGHNVRGFTYAFVNPTCVKRVKIRCLNAMTEVNILVGNTASNLTVVKEVASVSANEDVIIDVPNDNYCMYVSVNGRVDSGATQIATLQFYGRVLNVSVPKMTSNTSPFYEVGATAQQSNTYAPWKAFDKDLSTSNESHWSTANAGAPPQRIWCDFKMAVVSKFAYVKGWVLNEFKEAKLQGSNDGTTWVDIGSIEATSNYQEFFVPLVNNTPYRYYGCEITRTNGSNNVCLIELQFYGLDYSEREFEPNSNKKWLYDHGLELEEIDKTVYSTGTNTHGTVTKNSNDITVDATTSDGFVGAGLTMDLTNYSKVWGQMEFEKTYGSSASESIRVGSVDSQGRITPIATIVNEIAKPTSIVLDISNIDTVETLVACAYAMKGKLTELWVE